MKAIVVDDEPIMLRSFLRLSKGLDNLEILETFDWAEEALEFAAENPIDVAFLDIEMPQINGIECAKRLREMYPNILIAFVSAYDNYIHEWNQIGGDYYILKPYKRETLEIMMSKLSLLSKRLEKPVQINTFGKFNVLVNGEPVRLSGKPKEILALIVTNRGKEISNESIYTTIWETREYSNDKMKVYYNALSRLKKQLEEAGIQNILISTTRGQMVNTTAFSCDYYDWLDGKYKNTQDFDEFMAEYSWGEVIIAKYYNQDM